MKNTMKFFAAAAICALLAACGPGDKAAATGGKGNGSQGTAAPNEKKATLMGGYTPKYNHRLRSQRVDSLPDGKFRHIVIVEYIGYSADEIPQVLAGDLKAAGLTAKGPSAGPGGAQRFFGQNSKIGQLTADLSTNSTLKLGRGANGTVYYSWIDGKSGQ